MSLKKNYVLLEDCRWQDFAKSSENEGLKTSREKSMKWDEDLGFNILKVEEDLYSQDPHDEDYHSRAWMGLPFQTLQTPYSEIITTLNLLKDFRVKRVIDLGAGYGRVGLMVKLLRPNCDFIGYEMVGERVKEGKRVYQLQGLNPQWLKCENIVEESFDIPESDIYFLYDFSDPQDLKVVLDQLTENFFQKEFFLIAKGKAVNSLIQMKYPVLYAAHGRHWVEDTDCVIYSSFIDMEELKKVK